LQVCTDCETLYTSGKELPHPPPDYETLQEISTAQANTQDERIIARGFEAEPSSPKVLAAKSRF
jgi:hypothetical protein